MWESRKPAALVLTVLAVLCAPLRAGAVVPSSADGGPTLTLEASAAQVSVGDLVTLHWVAKDADSLRAAGAWKGSQEMKGTLKVRITTRGKSVFRLTATSAAGKESARVVVMATRKAKALTIKGTDAMVMVGTRLPVTASGLAPGETWTIRAGGQVLATGTATDKGTLAETLTLPKTLAQGVLALTITGSNPGRTGSSVLKVLGPKQLTVGLESDSVAQGGTQDLALTGLLPGEPVSVTYHDASVAKGVADAQGRFALTFEVGKKKGEQSVSVVGGDPSRTGEATFTVIAKQIKPTSL